MAKKNLFIFNDGGFITDQLERLFAFEMVKVKECCGVYGWNGDIYSFCRRLIYNEYRTVPHNYEYFYINNDSKEYKTIKDAIGEYLKTEKNNEDLENLKYKIINVLDSLAYKRTDEKEWNKFIKYVKNIGPEEHLAILEATRQPENKFILDWVNNTKITVKIFWFSENRVSIAIDYENFYFKSFEVPDIKTAIKLINYALSRAKSYRRIKEMNAIISGGLN